MVFLCVVSYIQLRKPTMIKLTSSSIIQIFQGILIPFSLVMYVRKLISNKHSKVYSNQDDSTMVRSVSHISSSKALKLITGFCSFFEAEDVWYPYFIKLKTTCRYKPRGKGPIISGIFMTWFILCFYVSVNSCI